MIRIIFLVGFFLPTILKGQANYDSKKDMVFTSLEEALREPERVFRLELRNQNLTALPKDIHWFVNLEVLDLSGNKLKKLDGVDFSNFQNLKILLLEENRFTSIPLEIHAAPRLEYVNLGSNKISSLDTSLMKNDNLRKLHLYHNQITIWPKGLQINSLEELRLDGNTIEQLPMDFFTISRKISVLNLNNNRMKHLPIYVDYPALKKLDIGSNAWTSLDFLGKFRNLEILINDWNTMHPLDFENIFTCSKIQTLSLEHCEIMSIPNSISNLKHLEELSLIGNSLPALPSSLPLLKRLKKIWLGKNEFDGEEQEKIKQEYKQTEVIF